MVHLDSFDSNQNGGQYQERGSVPRKGVMRILKSPSASFLKRSFPGAPSPLRSFRKNNSPKVISRKETTGRMNLGNEEFGNVAKEDPLECNHKLDGSGRGHSNLFALECLPEREDPLKTASCIELVSNTAQAHVNFQGSRFQLVLKENPHF